MRFFNAPAAVLGLLALTILPSVVAKPYPVHIAELRDLHNGSQIERRQCGKYCGFYGQLCCRADQSCGTDANNQAMCVDAAAAPVSGDWQYWTSTWVDTELVTKTTVLSSPIGAPASPTGTCGGGQQPCNSECCGGGYYCHDWQNSVCKLFGGSSSPGVIIGTLTPSAPLRPTASTLIIVTATGTPTATLPFSTPIQTGANGTAIAVEGGGGGLSGGAIAGIVIGVIAGLILLFLLCMYCCAKTAFAGIAAMLGMGKKKNQHVHEETYIEEHHHSHAGGAAAVGGGRRWYGQSQPARPAQPKKKGGFGGALGVGAALGGLALALGMKRKHDKRHDDKSTTISGSSAYYSDYTSSSKFPRRIHIFTSF